MKARILVVDDDPIVADSLREFLSAEGYDAVSCYAGAEAIAALAEAAGSAAFDVALTDVSMPGTGGMDLLRHVAAEHPGVVVIMLTGYGTIESAVEAIRSGATDYLSKPIVDAELRIALERALRQRALISENASLRKRLGTADGNGGMLGQDHRIRKAFDLVDTVAPTKATVLITGESGTGKSLIARAIHDRSSRRKAPFVEIHCGSIPETLLESELFGHVRGAFTGAATDKIGRFQAADTGTIFIDEINSASPGMQLKLLRMLQERKFEPVGSTKTIEVDTRVILASNQALEPLVESGQFRTDLYYRINVVHIDIPPLRDRSSDIPLLVRGFLEKMSARHGKVITGITDEALAVLQRHDYPGNVRELENIIERAVVLSARPTVSVESLPSTLTEGRAPAGGVAEGEGGAGLWEGLASMPLADALQGPEKQIILAALRAHQWNRQATADALRINRTTLYKKMKQYSLDRRAG